MVPLPVVRSFLKNDVMNLAAHFVACDYMEGNGVFYVALENNEGKTMDVIDNIIDSWSENWVLANDAFEKILQADEDLIVFFWQNVHGMGRKPPYASMVAHY